MAIIYTYGYDSDLQDNDAWIGTNSGNRKTKQFKALAIAEYLNKQGKVSIGGQMNYIFNPSVPNLAGSFTSTGNIKPFASITSLRAHVNDLGQGNVVDFMTYIVGSQLLIAQQNTPSKFGHYVINSYTATADPEFYNLALTYIGGNGSLIDETYYDLVALNIPDGTGSGVDTITTTDSTFISSTPSIPTAGNVTVTSSLSATGTPDDTTYLRGDNTWASIPPGLAGSGTTNYVAKWSATDTLTDSVIYDNGTNIGIGTTSPSQKLHVSGVTYSTNGFKVSNGFSIGALGENSAIRFNGGNVLVNNSSATEFVRFDAANSRVGIGTTSPTAKLEVAGDIKLLDNSALSWSTSNTRIFGQSGYMQFQVGATDKMRITSAGNVGIGTTAPSHLLSVAGNLSFASAADGTNYMYFQRLSNNTWKLDTSGVGEIYRITGNSVFYKQNLIVQRGGLIVNPTLGSITPTTQTFNVKNLANTLDVFSVLDGGSIGLGGYGSGTFTGTATQKLAVDSSGNVIEIPIGSGPVDGSGTANYVTKWSDADTITDSVIYDDGTNIGIGTTSPSQKLDVAGSITYSGQILAPDGTAANPSITFANESGTPNTGIFRSSENVIGISSGGIDYLFQGNVFKRNTTGGFYINSQGTTAASPMYSFESYTGNGMFRPTGVNELAFSTNSNERLRITSAGNVGIGTTAPASKLYVEDDLGAAGNLLTLKNSNLTYINAYTFGTEGKRLKISGGTSSDDAVLFEDTMYVGMGSNTGVGIGTTSPAYKLEVNGTTRLNGRLTLGGNVNNFIQGSGGDLQLNSVSDFNFVRSGNTLVTIKDTGNVGIGTTSPTSKLDVAGNIRIGQNDQFHINNSNVGFYRDSNDLMLCGYGNVILKSSATGMTSQTERMRITSSGNVGIGTTAPSELLNIAGNNPNIRLDDTSALTRADLNTDIRFHDSTGAEGSYIGHFASANLDLRSTAGGIRLGTFANAQLLNLVGSNVGIGTTSPTQSLHVNGSVRIADVIYDSNNSPGTAGQVLSKPTNDTIAWVNKDSITSIPTSITATPGGSLSLASNIDFVYFTWSGGSGTYTLNLPIASTHAYKIIRFVCNSTITANDKIHIQGSLGDTVDGSLFYELNKPYNGVQVWSDGSEWIVIQAKAT